MNAAQRIRVLWIDAMAARGFGLNRADVERAFRITHAQASLDLRLYRRLFPGCVEYDRNLKRYVPTGVASGVEPAAHVAALGIANALLRTSDLFDRAISLDA